MYFVLQTPSLQHIALVKIVADVWNDMWNRHILTQVAQSLNGLPLYALIEDSDHFKEAKEKVKSYISALPLPESCKTQLLNLIHPLGWEIHNWCKYHGGKRHDYRFLQNTLPRQFCWTLHGVIDYAKTAELMVKDERVDVVRRFELACINCLKSEARQLFEIMTEERMREYVDTLEDVVGIELYCLIVFFTRTLRVDRRRLNRYFPAYENIPGEPSIKNDVFEDTLGSGNRRMCEYVFKRFKHRQKRRVLEDCLRLVLVCGFSPTCNLLYYLSLLNEEQQRRVLRERVPKILNSLLHWPMQSLFMETLKCEWQFMTQRACSEVLLNIVITICYSKDYDYCQLFWEVWRLSPVEHKQFYFDNVGILSSLLVSKREELIKLLLNEANSHQMENLYNNISREWTYEGEISDAALMQCKNSVESISSNYNEDGEMRLKSQRLGGIIDTVMEIRIKRREKYLHGRVG